MRIRSFIISYALVLAIVLFADRRPNPALQQDRYSHVVDLTDAQKGTGHGQPTSHTQIIAPDALIPGTWTAAQIPPERLIAPLVVIDLKVDDLKVNDPKIDDSNVAPPAQISLDDIANWETEHGAVPQGAVVAIRQTASRQAVSPSQTSPSAAPQPTPHSSSARLGSSTSASMGSNTSAAQPAASFPITAEAAQFLMDARYTIGFAVDSRADVAADRALSRQIALHGSYVVEDALLTAIPATGSLIIVAPEKAAPAKDKKLQSAPVRVLAMVR